MLISNWSYHIAAIILAPVTTSLSWRKWNMYKGSHFYFEKTNGSTLIYYIYLPFLSVQNKWYYPVDQNPFNCTSLLFKSLSELLHLCKKRIKTESNFNKGFKICISFPIDLRKEQGEGNAKVYGEFGRTPTHLCSN